MIYASREKLYISYVKEYKARFLFRPEIYWPKEYFIERVYSSWAADELINEIKNKEHKSIYDATGSLITKFYKYHELADTDAERDIFSIGLDSIESIEHFITTKRRKCYASKELSKKYKKMVRQK